MRMRSAWGTGRGRRITWCTMEKRAVLAPMHRARVSAVVSVNALSRASSRRPTRRSRAIQSKVPSPADVRRPPSERTAGGEGSRNDGAGAGVSSCAMGIALPPLARSWWREAAASLVVLLAPGFLLADEPLRLRYGQPAERWTEALPVGNGRLGAMVFGGVASERLQLNEATLWSGGPKDWNNPGARKSCPRCAPRSSPATSSRRPSSPRRCRAPTTSPTSRSATCACSFTGDAAGTPSSYERSLDLDRAVATVRYRVGEATFTREVFSSFPDQVIVVRLTCDQPGTHRLQRRPPTARCATPRETDGGPYPRAARPRARPRRPELPGLEGSHPLRRRARLPRA